MSKALSLLLVGVAQGVLGACSTVGSEAPVGQEPLSIDAEEWEGAWLWEMPTQGEDDDPAVFLVRVLDAERGELEIGLIDESREGFEVSPLPVTLRTGGEDVFVSVAEEPGGPYAFLGVISKSEGRAVLWMTDYAQVAALIDAGSLPGVVKRADDGRIQEVVLGELLVEHHAFLAAGAPPIYRWRDPVILRRLAPRR